MQDRVANQGWPIMRYLNQPTSASTKAFTLVELIVVIGVIALLIAILAPALSTSREQSRRTACLSNLRQLAVMLHVYADSHAGRLPNGNPVGMIENEDLNLVLVEFNMRFVHNPAIFHCPSDEQPRPELIETSDYNQPNSARVSYDFYSIWWDAADGPRLSKLGSAPVAWDLDGGETNFTALQNHGRKGGNVAFADGHASWQQQKTWDGGNWPNPADKYYLNAGRIR
jgi:prepilin-type processing-associated H-X9-DG protein/prepilin-type N-terminal cleavage/methylation domain-containing protein